MDCVGKRGRDNCGAEIGDEMAQAWKKFTLGRAPAGPGAEGWSPLVSVTHATHLLPAIRIAEDRALSAELIYDGILKSTRTKVVYFSPNTWNEGSRYGAFEFTVDWSTLLAGRKLYWVEDINSYRIPIYRFLLSSKDVSDLGVHEYDADAAGGPIRRVEDEWFWATGYAAEVVIDDDLPLLNVTRFGFGQHHDHLCSEGRNGTCQERGYDGSSRAIGSLMGVLLGRDINSLDDLLTKDGLTSGDGYRALSNMWPLLMRGTGFGGTVGDPERALDLVRAAVLSIQAGDRERVKRLMGLIIDEPTADAAYLRLIREHFDNPTFVWED